jgi:hypothetical protein
VEQKVKQVDGSIGVNIRQIRLRQSIGQTELVGMFQLQVISMNRECLVKLERGIRQSNRWKTLLQKDRKVICDATQKDDDFAVAKMNIFMIYLP